MSSSLAFKAIVLQLDTLGLEEIYFLEEAICDYRATLRGFYYFIPDYRFIERTELQRDPEGYYCPRCDAFAERVESPRGAFTGRRCPLCQYTIWFDPYNGGVHDKRPQEEIWTATKAFEARFNFGWGR